jgi:hypothetical protein
LRTDVNNPEAGQATVLVVAEERTSRTFETKVVGLLKAKQIASACVHNTVSRRRILTWESSGAACGPKPESRFCIERLDQV